MNKLKSEQKTAYHEAGHAVASWIFRHKFSFVSITPTEDCLGMVKHPDSYLKNFDPDIDNSRKTLHRLEREIIILLAGLVAETFFVGRHDWQGASPDYRDVVDLALYATGSGDEATAYIKWLSIRTERLLRAPRQWEPIKALAKELMIHKKINYQKAKEIMEHALEEYRQSLINRNYRPDLISLDPEEVMGYRLDVSTFICRDCIKMKERSKIKKRRQVIQRRNISKNKSYLCSRCQKEIGKVIRSEIEGERR